MVTEQTDRYIISSKTGWTRQITSIQDGGLVILRLRIIPTSLPLGFSG